MTRQRSIHILACLWLMISLLTGGEAQAWMCDGRVCSTAVVCCCLSPSQQQDAQCRTRSRDTHIEKDCGADCKCKLMVRAATSRDATVPSHGGVTTFVAVLPARPLIPYLVPAASEAVLLHLETRGPPRTPLLFLTPSLRAPPIA